MEVKEERTVKDQVERSRDSRGAFERLKKQKDEITARDRERVFNALAETVLEMSDEEIAQEIRDEGGDPDEVAKHVRAVLTKAVQECIARERSARR